MKILVLLEYGIERKTNDLDNLYLRTYSNCTSYDKVFKQTYMLKRRAYYEYLLQGNVLGNNVNVFNNKDDGSSFTGAVVGDPLLNDHTGVELLGIPSMFVFDDAVDFDFSAMYPNATVAFNIERNTMIGKLIIPEFTEERYDHIFVNEEIYNNASDEDDDDVDDEPEVLKAYDAGKDFIEGYLSGDVISLGTKWFNLPSYDKINEEFKKKHKIKSKTRISSQWVRDAIHKVFNIKIE